MNPRLFVGVEATHLVISMVLVERRQAPIPHVAAPSVSVA
jgi:hypothetical protein